MSKLRVNIEYGPFYKCGRLVFDDARLQKLQYDLEHELGFKGLVIARIVPIGSRIERLSKPEEQNLVTIRVMYKDIDTSKDCVEIIYQVESIRQFNHDGTGEKFEEAKMAVRTKLDELGLHA